LTSFHVIAQRNDNAVQIDVSTSNYNGSLQNGSWSPNNEKLMCTNWIGGYNQFPANIFIINLSNNMISEMTTDGESNVNMPGHTWNALTNKIIFSSEHNGNGDQVHIMSPNDGPGSALKITLFTDRMCWEPGFSPSGDVIVYEAHYFNNEEIGIIETFKIDASESAIQLTDGSFNVKQPTWSPLGNKIVYQKFNGTVWNIWTMNTDGSNKQNITSTDPGDKTDATFSPNGEWIVYSSDHGTLEYANIFIKNLATGQLIQTTDYPTGYDGAPSWGTNNKIVFESTIGEPDTSPGATLWVINAPVDGTVGIETISDNHLLKIYPNPAINNIYIEISNKFKTENITVSLYNEAGQFILAEYDVLSDKINLKISGLTNGIYFVKISNGIQTESFKFSKHN